jgi:hypothetical protein
MYLLTNAILKKNVIWVVRNKTYKIRILLKRALKKNKVERTLVENNKNWLFIVNGFKKIKGIN